MFLANYGDTLTDADLPAMIERMQASSAAASFLAVRPNYSFHIGVDGRRAGSSAASRTSCESDVWINGGYFVMRSEVLDEIRSRRRAGRGAVPPADRRRDGCSPNATMGSGLQWTRSRTSSSSSLMHDSGRAPWELWAPSRDDELELTADSDLMLPLLLRDASDATSAACSLIGAHSDDIEIGCGGTLLKLHRRRRDRRGQLGGVHGRRPARCRGDGQRAARSSQASQQVA